MKISRGTKSQHYYSRQGKRSHPRTVDTVSPLWFSMSYAGNGKESEV